jgi:hypothetical protein
VLFACAEEEEEDAGLANMALSILGAVELRQPQVCDFLASLGVVPLYVELVEASKKRETCKLALMGLRNLMSHPENVELKEVALGLGAEQACRKVRHAGLTQYVEDCLRDLGLENYRVVV